MTSYIERRLRTRFVRATALALSTLAAVTPLRAQSDGTEQLNDAKARAAIQLVLRNTQAKGVSIEPLIKKVREGLSKQSDPRSIQAAVQNLAQRLEASHKALALTVSTEELSAGADALQEGVPAPTLRELRKIWKTKPLTVPLGILTELVAQKVPTAQAAKKVRELMERGVNNAQLVALQSKVEADVAAGLAPDAALELRAKGVMSLLSGSHSVTGTLLRDPITGTVLSGPRIRP